MYNTYCSQEIIQSSSDHISYSKKQKYIWFMKGNLVYIWAIQFSKNWNRASDSGPE